MTERTDESLAQEWGGHWSGHPRYPVPDWKYEVANDDTRLGYWAWVAEKLRLEDDA